MDDFSKFPAPDYKTTVLLPLFEGYKRHFRQHLMAIHHAHGLMLAERGWLKPHELAPILHALDDATRDVDLGALIYTGEHEDYFFWLEHQLYLRIGADLAGRLHTGRSRNDIDHTIFKMALRDRILALLAQIDALLAVLLTRAETGAATLIVAYTHGQPAQPTTFGHYLAAFIEILLRDSRRLLAALSTVDRSSLGAAAITTSGFGLDRRRTADLLGFEHVQENSYGCIAAVDYIAETYANLKILTLNIGRFVADLNAWTGFEIAHLHVPNAYVQVSSIMPQKRNPVPVEHLRLLCSLAAGRAETILHTLHNTPFTDMNDSEGEVQEAGYTAFDTAGRALTLLTGFMQAVTINEAQVRRHIAESCVCITEVADSLVREEGISFRHAHDIAANLAQRMIASGETLATLPFEALTQAMGRPPTITEARFRTIGTPEHFIAVRTMQGGPAALATSLAVYAQERTTIQQACSHYHDRIEAAATSRARLVADAKVPR